MSQEINTTKVMLEAEGKFRRVLKLRGEDDQTLDYRILKVKTSPPFPEYFYIEYRDSTRSNQRLSVCDWDKLSCRDQSECIIWMMASAQSKYDIAMLDKEK